MFLVNYYHKFFSPYIAMVIVEQGTQATVDSATLPANCEYIFLRDEGVSNRERCFAAGISRTNSSRKFVILSDSDIYLETLDIRANLRMCERYDYVTGFSKIIDLTNENSLRLRTKKSTQGLDITNNTSAIKERPGCCGFLNREALQLLQEGSIDALVRGAPVFSAAGTQFRVFESPNHALRLRQD